MYWLQRWVMQNVSWQNILCRVFVKCLQVILNYIFYFFLGFVTKSNHRTSEAPNWKVTSNLKKYIFDHHLLLFLKAVNKLFILSKPDRNKTMTWRNITNSYSMRMHTAGKTLGKDLHTYDRNAVTQRNIKCFNKQT